MGENLRSHAYDDIIDLPNPTSRKHPRMSLYNRAAQFSPFAALTGYEAAIQETARLTTDKEELSEDAIAKLNEQLHQIREAIDAAPVVTITYFVPDGQKSGGAYRSYSGAVKKIDEYRCAMVMTDNTVIPIEQIREIRGELFEIGL